MRCRAVIARPGLQSEIFVLPTALDFNLLQREALGHAIGEARRARPEIALHHDDVDPAHPLVVQALADQVAARHTRRTPDRRSISD